MRVTVTSGTRRADLALPGGVRVAELVPELTRTMGLLDAATVHLGYRLMTLDGRILGADTGLVSQGVTDGAVLVVAPDVDETHPAGTTTWPRRWRRSSSSTTPGGTP